MRRFWRNLPFFWKVYTGAVALICIVVLLAEFAEDFIPYMVNKRESNLIVLEEWLDRYEQANPAGRKGLRAAMRGQGVWFIELPPGVHESQAAQLAAGDLPRRPILDLLPESDDWEHDWTVVDRKLPSGELLAAGIPEPQ